jgi:FkbM family methyltransferase
MRKVMWLFRLLAAGVFVMCTLMHLRKGSPVVKRYPNTAIDTEACPDIISSENIVEMHYATGNEKYSFLVSLHPPDEDHVLSKGIKEGLFGPKNKYPSVDEMHTICETNAACNTGNVFVEVGSALGVISVYMGRRGMKVYAFDPVLPNIQRLSESRCLNNARLCRNTTENDCRPFFSQSNFHAMWHAVSSGEGPRSVQMQSEPRNMAATMRGGGSFKAEVQITTIDESVNEESIELLLLTCQGNEYNALLGASKFLISGKIRNIVFRRHSTRPEHDESALGIMRLLDSYGYIFFNLDATRASGRRPDRVTFDEMLNYITKSRMSGGHSNILASLPRQLCSQQTGGISAVHIPLHPPSIDC